MAASSNSRALLAASSGAAGALFSMACLYPLDLAKTNIQASTKEEGAPTPSLPQQLAQIVKAKGPLGLFRGIEAKSLQTLISAFAYFYLSSYIKSAYIARHGQPATAASLSLECVAACGNVSMTLPLDVITTRLQIAKGGTGGTIATTIKKIVEESGVTGFWSGYGPSLLLSVNPAITFTAFDKIKEIALRGRGAGASLSALEAFLIGALAKSIATMLTFPLIRAKVVLMAQQKGKADTSYAGTWDFLTRVGRAEGLAGLYLGCSSQLLNTVLKSALMLMTKEQVSAFTVAALTRMGVGASPASS